MTDNLWSVNWQKKTFEGKLLQINDSGQWEDKTLHQSD